MRQIGHKPIYLIVTVSAASGLRYANWANTIITCYNPPDPLYLVSWRNHLNSVINSAIIHVLRKGINTLQYAAVAKPVVTAFSFQKSVLGARALVTQNRYFWGL